MIRRAEPDDLLALGTFLATHSDETMFLQGNLAAHGLHGAQHRHATDVLLWKSGRDIDGVVGLSRGGFLMAYLRNPGVDLTGLRDVWAGRTVLGMSAGGGHIAPVLAALGLEKANTQLDAPEPLYALDLADLPNETGSIRPPGPEDEPRLAIWFREYAIETGQAMDTGEAAADAAKRAAQVIAEPEHVRLLIERGLPVAMTAFNAVLPDRVQIGGVYVPPGQRDRKLARKVVALHLAEARGHGVERAVLFAASRPAARAYEGLGFNQVGTYRVCLFAQPQRIVP